MNEFGFRIHKLIKNTHSEGPGNRLVFWVQGCSRHCDGCYEKDTWKSEDGYDISLSSLLAYLSDDIDGVTILGGEPFEQSRTLAKFLVEVRKCGKNSIVFTGNRYDDLVQDTSEDVQIILQNVDLLVDGEFDRSLLETQRPMVGSTNQKFIPLSPIGTKLRKQILSGKNKVEIRIGKDGSVMINGMWKDGNIKI